MGTIMGMFRLLPFLLGPPAGALIWRSGWLTEAARSSEALRLAAGDGRGTGSL